MKYDPHTKRVQRDASDKERHRQVRERLHFAKTPTAAEVAVAVDSLVEDGLLPAGHADRGLTDLAQALRDERERQGLSLTELAVKTGLDEAAISDLETGQRQYPSLLTLAIWAQALGKRVRLTLSDT